jgi:septum site-determining protein MinD
MKFVFWQNESMARTILITSGKGGVGKTTCTFNLGVGLSKLNKKTVLIDLDLGLNNLDVVSGIENHIIYDIVDVAAEKCRVKQALIQSHIYPHLYILPTCQNYGKHLVTAEKLEEIITVLSETFDYILVDCPAGVEEGFFKAAKVCTEAIIVTTPHLSAVRDAAKVCTILKGMDFEEINLAVNRVRGDLTKSGEMLAPNVVANFVKAKLFAILPESDYVNFAANTGTNVKGGEIEKALTIAAKNLDGGGKTLYDAEKPFKGYFKRRQMKKRFG